MKTKSKYPIESTDTFSKIGFKAHAPPLIKNNIILNYGKNIILY